MNEDRTPPGQSWESALDHALKKLPERPAPETLIPGVLRILEARARAPWHRRAWWQWPLPMRIASAAASVALLLTVIWLIGVVPSPKFGGELAASVDSARHLLVALTGAMQSVLAAVAPPETARIVLLCFTALVIGLYLTCVGLGAVVYQLARIKPL